MWLGRGRLCAIVLLMLAGACAGEEDGAAPTVAPEVSTTTSTTSIATTIEEPDLPSPPDPPVAAVSSFDPAAVAVCAIIDPASVAALVGADDVDRVVTDLSSASVDPFGAINTCTWSTDSAVRGLSLGVTAPQSSLDELLALSLVTDAALGFDRRPVAVGDEALAQVADSTTQGVGRLCIASRAAGAVWLACLSEVGRNFGLDDAEVDSLAQALDAGFLAQVESESEPPTG